MRGRFRGVLNYKMSMFWMILTAVVSCIALAVYIVVTAENTEQDLSFLNYENASLLVADVSDVKTLYYPKTKMNENGIISSGYSYGIRSVDVLK